MVSVAQIASGPWPMSDSEWAVAHARGSSEGSQGCREDADDDL